jgi:hypothetical protein
LFDKRRDIPLAERLSADDGQPSTCSVRPRPLHLSQIDNHGLIKAVFLASPSVRCPRRSNPDDDPIPRKRFGSIQIIFSADRGRGR